MPHLMCMAYMPLHKENKVCFVQPFNQIDTWLIIHVVAFEMSLGFIQDRLKNTFEQVLSY
jgi:hypothetical protein